LGDPEVTHDIVVRVMRTLGAWRGVCALRTWVFRITGNELARRERGMSPSRVLPLSEVGDAVVASGATPEDLLAARDERCRFAAALSRIALRRRLCFLGLTVLGFGAKSVAAWPGVGGSPTSVRQAASKARAHLRRLLGRRGAAKDHRLPLPACEVRDRGRCTADLDGWLTCPVVVPPAPDVGLAQERGSR
jgi:DNA-directed RNA polymerase specialized sigma24 family protein